MTRIVLGCGNFGGIGSAPELFGRGESEQEAFAIMDAAWDAGIRWFDTADAYGGGRSESADRRVDPRDRQPPAADDEDLQPDGRGRGSRARAGPHPPPDRDEPRAARRRPRRHVSRARVRPGDAVRRVRAARSSGSSRRGRSAPTASRTSTPSRWRPRSRPGGRRSSRTSTRCSNAATRTASSRSAPSAGSTTRPSARSPAAG